MRRSRERCLDAARLDVVSDAAVQALEEGQKETKDDRLAEIDILMFVKLGLLTR